MTAINPATGNDAHAALGLAMSPKGRDTTLGQADFLLLLTEQLKNQDPLKPMDNTQFLGQLAQFSTVQGISGMQSAMNSMASVMESDQALRAAALVGRDALVAADSVQLPAGGGVNGEIGAEYAGPVRVEIIDAAGASVRHIDLQAGTAGPLGFAWDGLAADGQPVPAGRYSVRASSGSGDAARALDVRLAARVDSVSIESTGLVLNLAGLGSHPLSSIRQVGG